MTLKEALKHAYQHIEGLSPEAQVDSEATQLEAYVKDFLAQKFTMAELKCPPEYVSEIQNLWKEIIK